MIYPLSFPFCFRILFFPFSSPAPDVVLGKEGECGGRFGLFTYPHPLTCTPSNPNLNPNLAGPLFLDDVDARVPVHGLPDRVTLFRREDAPLWD